MKPLVTALLLAYVMPSYGVLKRVAAQRDEVPVAALRAQGTAAIGPALAREAAALLGTSWQSGELPLQATLSVRFPGRCRLELAAPDSTKTVAATWSQGKGRTEGGELPALQVAVEQACALLSMKSADEGATREALSRHLGTLKVDTKQIGLARFLGHVAYALGSRDAGQASFWVYKDRFLPARALFTDARGAWDVRFKDFTSQATGDWWPRVLEVYRSDALQLRVMLLTADPKANLDAVKF